MLKKSSTRALWSVVGCSCIAPVIIERMAGEIRLFTSSGTILRDKPDVKRHKGNGTLVQEGTVFTQSALQREPDPVISENCPRHVNGYSSNQELLLR